MFDHLVVNSEIDVDNNYFNQAYPSINDSHADQNRNSATFHNLY